jgi:methionine synthase II (cobalamin-independent)
MSTHEAQSLHLRYGPSVALPTLNSCRCLHKPKARFPVGWLPPLPVREFHPLEAPSFAWRAEYVLKINAGSFSFEAANPRHEHEYHLFEQVKVPEGKVLCPGVITHASNIVEHPEWIAERLIRFAKLVGRENVMAGADCGFSSQALHKTEVHPTVVWEKFKAMRQGADLATKRLWN